MPLTDFQRKLLAVLGPLRSPESYLAGGAALVWAAVGKDPGYTSLSLIEQLKRRGRYHPEVGGVLPSVTEG